MGDIWACGKDRTKESCTAAPQKSWAHNEGMGIKIKTNARMRIKKVKARGKRALAMPGSSEKCSMLPRA